jgi:hypothetical protein
MAPSLCIWEKKKECFLPIWEEEDHRGLSLDHLYPLFPYACEPLTCSYLTRRLF